MNTNISLSADKFDEFIRCLSILRDICNDVDIKNGIIRQRTTDNTTVFEINLQKILQDDTVNIPIIGLKQKLDLLKCFSGHDVELDVNDRRIIISDSDSSIEIKISHLEFMDNKYISKEEANTIFSINDENKILDTKISKVISERMRVITQVFNSTTVQVLFEGDVASISAKTQAKDQSAKFVSGIMLDEPIEDRVSNLVIIPFIIDHDNDIEFRMYCIQKDKSHNEFRTSISDDIDINVYTRSKLIKKG